MPKLACLAFACLLVAQGCVVTPGTSGGPTPKASKPAVVAASPGASPVASPAAAKAPGLLARPAGNVSALTGVISLDANHQVQQGGTLITNDGGGLITNDGAGLAVAEGNAVISRDGAGLIGNDGGGLIGNDGGGLIGNDGAGVISRDGAGYRLAAASASVALGQELPVAGAQVAVRSLATGKLLPIGQDADGKPVTTIISNRQGRFQAYLPPDAGVVVVESAWKAGDGHVLTYGAFARPGGTCEVDEETQLVTRYLINAYATRLATLVTTEPDTLALNKDFAPFKEITRPFYEVGKGLTAKQLQAASQRVAGLLLSRPASLDHAPVYALTGAVPQRMDLARKRNEERQLATGKDVLVDVFRATRRAVVARMRKQDQPEAYFDALPQVATYRDKLDLAFHVRYATDFVRFMVNAYLAAALEDDHGISLAERNRFEGIQALMEGRPVNPEIAFPSRYVGLFPPGVGFSTPPALGAGGDLGADGLADGEAYRLYSGSHAVSQALLEQLFLQEGAEELRAQLMAILKDAANH